MSAKLERNPALLVALILGGSTPARAEPPASPSLTETAVIRLVRARDPGVQRAQAEAQRAAADEVGADAYPNPGLSWEREHLPDADEAEDVLALSIPIALSGARASRRSLARTAHASARADALRSRSEATRRALELFYAALWAERRVAIERTALAQLEEGAAVLTRRHAEGTASGYERARIEVELELSRSELMEAEADAGALRARLARLLSLEATPALSGTLVPPATPRPAPAAVASAQLDAEAVTHARDASSDAGSAWLPTLELTGGVKLAHGADDQVGYVVGAGFALPLFDHGQDLRAQAQATTTLAQARERERAWARSDALAEAQTRLGSARAALEALEARALPQLELLMRATRSGYVEGQRSVVELLDAQRAATEVARRQLSLQHAARHAELALREAQGVFE